MTVPMVILILLVATIGGLSFAEPSSPVITSEDRSIWSKIFRATSISSGSITFMTAFCWPGLMVVAYDNRQSEQSDR
jgi:hypothetical protein